MLAYVYEKIAQRVPLIGVGMSEHRKMRGIARTCRFCCSGAGIVDRSSLGTKSLRRSRCVDPHHGFYLRTWGTRITKRRLGFYGKHDARSPKWRKRQPPLPWAKVVLIEGEEQSDYFQLWPSFFIIGVKVSVYFIFMLMGMRRESYWREKMKKVACSC